MGLNMGGIAINFRNVGYSLKSKVKMETIFIIAIVVLVYWKLKKSANKNSIFVSLPDVGRPGTITKHQKRFLDERGLSGFDEASKQQASTMISCIRYAERVCEVSGHQDKITPTYTNELLGFIANDTEFRQYVHDRNQKLWKEGIDEDEVEPKRDEFFHRLKNFIES